MTIFLDLETTGLSEADDDGVVQVALLADDGRVLLESLVDPVYCIPDAATAIHGITDDMVRGAPPWQPILREILELVAGNDVVIYNAAFDLQWLHGLPAAARSVSCAMTAWADFRGYGWDASKGRRHFDKLSVAAASIGFVPEGKIHSALVDCWMTRAVWEHAKDNRKRA